MIGPTAFHIRDHSARLQATRGIAALCVTVGHCFTTMVNGRIEEPTFQLSAGNAALAAGELIFQANTAVIFFYVLSGLVLGESLRRRGGFGGFAVRRLWRLLPAMWLSIAFALLAFSLLPSPPVAGATRWFDAFLTRPISAADIVSDLVGLSWNVNSVLWSVQIELAMIILLPPLMYLSTRLGSLANSAVLAALALLSLFAWGKLPDWANAVLYLYCFYAGLILPQLLQGQKSRVILGSGAITVAALLALPVIDYLYVSNRLWMPYKFVADALISAQLLGFILSRPQKGGVKWLAARPLVWLGDVSYSFYVYSLSLQLVIAGALLRLLHSPPSDALATLLTLGLTFATVAIALGLAAVSYRWVELPGIAMGQEWSAGRRSALAPVASVASFEPSPTTPTMTIASTGQRRST